MPFPLAHPAAVLPLRRYCPRFLSFSALVWGSLAPDAGYFLGAMGADNFSHSFSGSLGFGLPVGLVLWGLFMFGARKLRPHLPESFRTIQPPPRRGAVSAVIVIVSILIGVWTHLLLDSVTHKDGWVVQHVTLLGQPIALVDGRNLRVCHLLWYGASFVGVAWLYLAFREWQEAQSSPPGLGPRRFHVFEAAVVASMVLPIELAHHLVHGLIGCILVGFLCLGLLTLIVVRSERRRRFSAVKASVAD